MKTMVTHAAWLLFGSAVIHAGDIQILSLSGNGQLTWTNPYPNALYSVQWAPNLPCTNWTESWDPLKNLATTSQVTTVSVPMFYRVKCLTNLFIPTVIGRQFIYSVSNTLSGTWTYQATFLGCLTLSWGTEYSILELLTPREIRLYPCRSTASEFYGIPFGSRDEVVTWKNAPSGTTWTNYYSDGSSDQMTILANEAITVPAGTFDCLKIEAREINNSLNLRWIIWVKPGFMMVKQLDYNRPTDPDVYSLTSWADRAPR